MNYAVVLIVCLFWKFYWTDEGGKDCCFCGLGCVPETERGSGEISESTNKL